MAARGARGVYKQDTADGQELDEIAQALTRSRRDTVPRDQQLYWQLLGGAADGCVDSIIEAITNGADVNFRDQTSAVGASALMVAASGGHGEAVDILLLYGADKSRLNQFQQSAYDLAAENGFSDIADRLGFEENFEDLRPSASPIPEVPANELPKELAAAANQPEPAAAAAPSPAVPPSADRCTALKAENEQMEQNLKLLDVQLKDAQRLLDAAELRRDTMKSQLAHSQAQQQEAEERSDKAAEVALDMHEELESLEQKTEELKEEQLTLESQNEALEAQRG